LAATASRRWRRARTTPAGADVREGPCIILRHPYRAPAHTSIAAHRQKFGTLITPMIEQTESTRIKSVLLLDDDERTLSAMARTLRHSRRVFTAKTTSEAAAVARRERPDLIVVDLRLAGASGLDVMRELKDELPGSRFALVSGYLTVDATVAAVRAGADVVLTKPVTAGEIVRRVEVGSPPPAEAETPTLAQAESEHIARVMADCNGNISEAARRLGIFRSSLQRRLRRLGLRE
jgi:two-component system response regulator RegA